MNNTSNQIEELQEKITQLQAQIDDLRQELDKKIESKDIENLQVKIKGECPEGYAFEKINSDGLIVCKKLNISQDLARILSNGNDAQNQEIRNLNYINVDEIKTKEINSEENRYRQVKQ